MRIVVFHGSPWDHETEYVCPRDRQPPSFSVLDSGAGMAAIERVPCDPRPPVGEIGRRKETFAYLKEVLPR